MKTIRIEHRQITLSYEEAGNGLPIVFLHAFPLDRTMWLSQIESLSKEYRVIAVDLPGFGESTDLVEGFTMSAVADVVADFLSAIGITEPIVLAGLSMGGYVALSFANRQPQRLRGLILADTKAEGDDEAAKAGRAKSIDTASQRGASGLISDMLPKLISPEGLRTRPTLGESVKGIASRQPVISISAALNGLRERPDASASLQWMKIPALVIVGEHDAITPVSVAEAPASRLPSAQLKVISGAGHLSNLEAPQEFNRIVREFLKTELKNVK